MEVFARGVEKEFGSPLLPSDDCWFLLGFLTPRPAHLLRQHFRLFLVFRVKACGKLERDLGEPL